jgi:hypothetical protein
MGQYGKESQMEAAVVLAFLVALGALVLGDGRGGSDGFRPQAARHHSSGRQGPTQPGPGGPTVPAEGASAHAEPSVPPPRRSPRSGRSRPAAPTARRALLPRYGPAPPGQVPRPVRAAPGSAPRRPARREIPKIYPQSGDIPGGLSGFPWSVNQVLPKMGGR